ncbi:FtsZ/tubulin family protein [Marinomonas gallaica]|uniref:hypothetical protein n=1 Tax=Marinomonas gallaica TaxID=1806667 RepID=UPI000829E640|nr:hypothetical protein [Marinomonas gallaica]
MNVNSAEVVFDLAEQQAPKILLVGVGGCGCSAVEVMVQTAILDKVTLAAVNTDQRELSLTKAPVQVPIGEVLTRGLGAGSMPHVGEQSARESTEALQDMIAGFDLVITVSGGGGGTGTGATPVLLEICEQQQVLTIAFVVRPFAFEGRRRIILADALIERCRKSAGTTFVLENAKLQQALGDNVKLNDALDAANHYINELISGLLAMIDSEAVARIDFAHFLSALAGQGMGHGAVIEADSYDGILEKLTDFPLLQGTPHVQSMQTNTQVLLHIWAPESFTLSDYAGVSEELHERLSGNLDLSSGFSVWGKPSFKVVLFVNRLSS